MNEQMSEATDGGAKAAPLSSEQLRLKALRDGIAGLMFECTEAQLKGLHRIHDNAPWKGLENCPDDKLPDTYELLRRTVMKSAAATGSAA